jgi:hypothetical protein
MLSKHDFFFLAAVLSQQHILIVCIVCDRPEGAFSNKVGKTFASESKVYLILRKADLLRN